MTANSVHAQALVALAAAVFVALREELLVGDEHVFTVAMLALAAVLASAHFFRFVARQMFRKGTHTARNRDVLAFKRRK